MVIAFELVAVLLTLALALTMRNRTSSPFFRSVRRFLSSIARRRALAVLLVGIVSFSINAGVAVFKPIRPRVHDDFSYLLAADTFLHGRLTNPTHPQWQHFETFHVIHEPTYQSKYPPAFGVMVAVGRLLGDPAIGIWLSLSLACASVCWMLQAWTRPYWALLGGLLMATHIGMIQWWGQMYWAAGAFSAVGGALVYGALRRLVKTVFLRDSILFMLGLLVLATSRPFEGFVFAIPAGLCLLFWIGKHIRQRTHQIVTKVVLPSLLGVVGILAVLGYYNWRVSGAATRLPYQIHEETYATAPLFLWQSPRVEPEYRHRVLQAYQRDFSMELYKSQTTPGRIFVSPLLKLLSLASFFLRPSLLLVLIFLPCCMKSVWTKFAAFVVLLELVALLAETFMNPHYFAPATGLLIFLVVQALRSIRLLPERSFLNGPILFRGLVTMSLISTCVGITLHIRYQPKPQLLRDVPIIKAKERYDVVEQLQQLGGKHLVLVQYAPSHVYTFEWVYNDADIDNAAIVWARPMSAQKNRELLSYFQDRKVWLLEADATPAKLREWPTNAQDGKQQDDL